MRKVCQPVVTESRTRRKQRLPVIDSESETDINSLVSSIRVDQASQSTADIDNLRPVNTIVDSELYDRLFKMQTCQEDPDIITIKHESGAFLKLKVKENVIKYKISIDRKREARQKYNLKQKQRKQDNQEIARQHEMITEQLQY